MTAPTPSVGDVFESAERDAKHQRQRVEVVDILPALLEPDVVLRNVETGKRDRVSLPALLSRWRRIQEVGRPDPAPASRPS